MRQQRNLSLIRFTEDKAEQAFKMKQRIGSAMACGRNVVLICEAPLMRRVLRMAFASLSVTELPGRFAIVTEHAHEFADSMPNTFRDRLHVFESQNDAFDWLDPNPEDENATLLDLSIN